MATGHLESISFFRIHAAVLSIRGTIETGLPELNFQVMRRTTATQAQSLGSVKDMQAHLRHAKADTTANEHMKELPESVQKMVGGVYTMRMKGRDLKQASEDLLPKATNVSEKHLASD